MLPTQEGVYQFEAHFAGNHPHQQQSAICVISAHYYIAIGKALRTLRQNNILFIGSGFSFHNMHAFFIGDQGLDKQNIAFEEWLIDTSINQKLSY